jgi:FMN phosphatase YigB (HAD superfamily)
MEQSKFSFKLLVLTLTVLGYCQSIQCKEVNTIFFDLGDTLIESNGMGQFILRADAQIIIDSLIEQNIPIGIITNVPLSWTRQDLENILVDPSFLDNFDAVILSSQAPADKPDPAIFVFAHAQISNAAPITQTAFVTESLEHIANATINPTIGARATGMIGIHLSDLIPSELTDYTIPTNDLTFIDGILNQQIFCNGFE